MKTMMTATNSINDNIISLNEENHTYSLNKSNIEFVSVTTYIGEFFEKFDQQKIAEKLVRTNIKYSGRTVEDVIAGWNELRDYGTLVHKQIEDDVNGVAKALDVKAKHGVTWLDNFLENRDYDLYVEKIIFSKESRLAGTMDVLIKIKDSNEYIIIDWKTNKKIDTRSFKNKKGIHPITSNVEDCKYNVYAFQLSLYRYILEEYYGLNIKQQIIAHINDYGVNTYLPPYYKGHIEAMLELRKDNN